jgi:hypothetical protein
MSKNISLKIVFGFSLLAIILVFLGVHFVPNSSASPSDKQSSTLDTRYAGSDWIERHPSNYFKNSDWIERHPTVAANQETYYGPDYIERNPSNYYDNSDWIERHPVQQNP